MQVRTAVQADSVQALRYLILLERPIVGAQKPTFLDILLTPYKIEMC